MKQLERSIDEDQEMIGAVFCDADITGEPQTILLVDIKRSELENTIEETILSSFENDSTSSAINDLKRDFPREGDLGLRRRLYKMLETAKTDCFRQCYACELQRVRDSVWSNVSLSPPDPALIQEELRTLAHFRRHRPTKGLAMKIADVLDGYEPIDWVALGGHPHS